MPDVAYGNVSSSSSAAGVSQLTFSHTASGDNRAVFVGVGFSTGGGAGSCTGVTYGGVAMTEKWDFTFSTNYGNAGYTLAGDVNIATGAQNVVVTLNATHDEVAAGAISLTNVNSGDPTGTANTTSGLNGSTCTIDITGVTGGLVVDNVYTEGVLTPDGGNTSRWEQESIGGFTSGGGSTKAGATSVTMSWNTNGELWGLGGICFKPSGGTVPKQAPMHSMRQAARFAEDDGLFADVDVKAWY